MAGGVGGESSRCILSLSVRVAVFCVPEVTDTDFSGLGTDVEELRKKEREGCLQTSLCVM